MHNPIFEEQVQIFNVVLDICVPLNIGLKRKAYFNITYCFLGGFFMDMSINVPLPWQ